MVGTGNCYLISMATTPGNQSRLRRLIREAGYSYQTVDRQRVEIVFGGPYRPWVVMTCLNEHWLSLCTYVCRIPESPGRKAELSELLLRLNEEKALANYSYRGGDAYLQLQYRLEHVDSEAMRGLIGLFLACANADYPRIVRVVTGDSALERLEKQFVEDKTPQ